MKCTCNWGGGGGNVATARVLRSIKKWTPSYYTHHSHTQSGGYTGIPLSVRPSALCTYGVTSHLSFVGFYSYMVSWLAMI